MQFKTSVKGIFLFLAMFLLVAAGPAHALVSDFEITESVPQPNVVQFSVSTIYDDVIGFVVGNDFGFDFSAAEDGSGWGSYMAYKNETTGGIWKIGVWEAPSGGSSNGISSFPSLTYYDFDELALVGFNPNDVTDGSFDGYNRAFVYYIIDANPPTINSTGFYAMAGQPDSNFAAFRETGDILLGETTIIPVPGAGILLFSGLAGLAGLRRKNR